MHYDTQQPFSNEEQRFHKQNRCIAEVLLTCSSVKDQESRKAILGQLPFENQVQYNNQNNVHVLNIINTARQYPRGLEILIEIVSSFENESLPMQNVYHILDTQIPQSIRWKQISFVKRILINKELKKDLIERFYYESSVSGSELSKSNNELLAYCIEQLAKEPHKAPRAPLLEFLTRLLSEIKDKQIQNSINEWIELVANEIKITLNDINENIKSFHSISSATQSNPYLLIKIEPDQWKENEYQVKGWVMYNNIYKLLSVPENSFSSYNLPKILESLIFESKSRLIAEFKKPTSEINKLIIEVFLPIDLLNSDIDEWKVKMGKFIPEMVLGHFHPIVIRSFERIYDEELRVSSWGRWKQKWENRPKTSTSSNIYWACGESDYCEEFFYELALSGLIFLGLTRIPPEGSKLKAIEILGPMLDAGTPIALWIRGTNLDAELIRSELEEFLFNNELDQIPDLVHLRRRSVFTEKSTESFWKSISLFWDDPDRIPPDVLFNLSAP